MNHQNVNQNSGQNFNEPTTHDPDNNNSTKNFIDFCKNYTNVNSNDLTCHECFNQDPNIADNTTRRVISNDGKNCFQSTTVGQCKKAQDIENCLECYDGRNVFLQILNNKNVCSNITAIDNCKEYFLTVAKAVTECKVCNDGYYLENKVCKKGYIPRCLVYFQN